MTASCDYCPQTFNDEDKLETHMLVAHREEASDNGFSFESPVSDGHLEEQEVEKGEQFGYE